MVDFKKHLASATPSLIPAPYVPKTRKDKPEPEVLPDLQDVAGVQVVDLPRIQHLVPQILEQKMIERQAVAKYAPLVEELKELLPLEKVKAMLGETKVSYYPQSRSTINKQLLLGRGVNPADIAAATLTATSWTLKLSLPGDEEPHAE